MASDNVGSLVTYLRAHPEVTSVLITGGDPMIMGEPVLRRYLEPLLDPSLEHLESIRIGTKSLAYWPQRFVTDPDATATLRLFEEVRAAGRTLAFMAHFSHPRELEPPVVGEAVRQIRDAGAVIRTQAPLIRSINDDPGTWASMWRTQSQLGMVPYYMFVERDTGPQDYFAVPLARAHEIFRDAYAGVSGLCRTVRGPSMSATPGKVCVDGVAEVDGLEGVRAAPDPGPAAGAGRAAVLRPLRPGGHLAVRSAAGLRGAVPVGSHILPVMELNAVTAIVSGGASGLGEATARELAAAGAFVVVADLGRRSRQGRRR